MSGQWEVVGKKRDKVNKQNPQKPTKENKKNNVVNPPKIEDVCKFFYCYKIHMIREYYRKF